MEGRIGKNIGIAQKVSRNEIKICILGRSLQKLLKKQGEKRLNSQEGTVGQRYLERGEKRSHQIYKKGKYRQITDRGKEGVKPLTGKVNCIQTIQKGEKSAYVVAEYTIRERREKGDYLQEIGGGGGKCLTMVGA